MKRKSYYTFIISKNSSSDFKKITVERGRARAILGAVAVFLLLLIAFLTDYFGQRADQWRMSQLERENSRLKGKFADMDSQLKDLEKKVYQISDFSRKLQLITRASPEQINSQMAFGKIHTNSAIIALSKSSPARAPAALGSPSIEREEARRPFYRSGEEELEIRIEKLKGQSELVKQDAWALYTDLLEKREILNNTPSILPVSGWMSSGFGYRNETIYSDHEPHFHRGVDIASSEGKPVVATADGKVIYTGYDENGYGNLVVIDHGYGMKTYYAHLAEISASAGEIVQRGEAIASVGSTGRSTGPHLHYEIRVYDIPVNPENYILDQSGFWIGQQRL